MVSLFDMQTIEQANARVADLQGEVAGHLDACRQRIPEFVEANYSWSGAIRLNRLAWGSDVAVAPLNFIMGFPNFVLRVVALLLDFFSARKAAQRLLRSHLGLPTTVQKTLTERLMADLLDLPPSCRDASGRLHEVVASAAREPVRIYVQTRNVAGDITAGTLAAVMGVFFFHQFTPGSISAGSAIAHVIATEKAVSEFALGEAFGRWYYAVFPVHPSLTVIFGALLVVMATIAVVAAFSGILHDPIQTLTGIHRRRLHQLLDAIEAAIQKPIGKGYRPKDTFFGRIYDLVDWIKGVLSF